MGTLMEIPHGKRESQRKFRLDKGLRDAIADHLRRRWPSGTAKHAARTYSISLDRAREAVAGRGSLTTIEAIFKRGGWPVALEILASVIGQQFAQHLIDLRGHHELNAGRFTALLGDGWPMPARRHDDSARLDLPEAERRITDRRRASQG